MDDANGFVIEDGVLEEYTGPRRGGGHPAGRDQDW